MKKVLFILIVFCGVFAIQMQSMAQDEVEVYFDGEKQDIIVSAFIIDSTVLVPIRPIFNLFNYKINWDNMRKRISTTTAIGKLKIQIGSVLVSQNDYQAYVLSTYPRIINGSTVIPIEFAAACTDSSIRYIESSNSIIINTK